MISSHSPLHLRETQRQPQSLTLENISSAFLVGICGSGMKALADLLTSFGIDVTGSDAQTWHPSMRSMKKRGLKIHFGHHAHFLPKETDVLIYSPAVGPNNPERKLAARLNIPQFSYSQMLGRLMLDRVGISVAGTHGKSTTTAMTAAVLRDAGLSPSAVVGAELCDSSKSGWAGESELFVVESCEYKRSFLDLHPTHALITGIEPDHFDYFDDFAETQTAFAEFASRVKADGTLFVNADCPASMEVAQSSAAEVVTFSTTSQGASANWWGTDFRKTDFGVRFRVFHNQDFFAEIPLPLFGGHNVANALCATALCQRAGATAYQIHEGLAEFRGIRRRFECVGSWRGVTLIDDYAHHPTAIQSTLKAARDRFGNRRIWCVFQPHQVSRTRALMPEFAASFDLADEVLIAPVYAAREALGDEPILLAQELASKTASNGRAARFAASLDRIIATLEDEAHPGDVLITMGAGDIDRVRHEFTRRVRGNHKNR